MADAFAGKWATDDTEVFTGPSQIAVVNDHVVLFTVPSDPIHDQKRCQMLYNLSVLSLLGEGYLVSKLACRQTTQSWVGEGKEMIRFFADTMICD